MCGVNVGKIEAFDEALSAQQEKREALLEHEQIVNGSSGKLVGFKELRAWFTPFYDLWSGMHDVFLKKKHWLDCSLSKIDPTEVDETVRTTGRIIKRL